MEKIIVKILSGICLVIVTGCATVNQKLEPSKFYRRDMALKVNGYQATGSLVVPYADKYDVEVGSGTKMDLFTLQSCHREWVATNESTGWFGTKKKGVKYEYKPLDSVERSGACGLDLGGYDKETGRHSWAFIDFETKEETLPALVRCNGSEFNARGVTVCQSRQGLWQEINFPVAVRTMPEPECNTLMNNEGQKFQFKVARGMCVYAFMELAKPNRIHRLTTMGYDEIVIRTEE